MPSDDYPLQYRVTKMRCDQIGSEENNHKTLNIFFSKQLIGTDYQGIIHVYENTTIIRSVSNPDINQLL